MKELFQQIENLARRIGLLESLQNGASVADASTTVKGIGKTSVAPVSATNPIFVGDNDTRMTNSRAPNGSAGGDLTGSYPNPTLAQNRVNLQSFPHTAQTGYIHVSNSIVSDIEFMLGTVTILQSGTTFPTSGLVDGQRYRHMTYRSWFTWHNGNAKWRQDAPGVFNGSFPTVAAGDNTVAPKIEIKRVDQDNTVYFWDGTRWLTTQLFYLQPSFAPGLTFPLAANTTLARGDNPEQTLDIYLVDLSMSSAIAATYNSTNFWTFQLVRIDNAGGTANVGSANSTWATGRVAGNRYPNVVALNTQITAANLAAYRLDLATSGAPGAITPNPPMLSVRYVG